MIALILAVASISPIPSAPGPSLDLLYREQLRLDPDGEPLLAIGIADGDQEIRIQADNLGIHYYQDGLLRSTYPKRGSELRFRIVAARAANRQYFVDLQHFALHNRDKLSDEITKWRDRGFEVQVLDAGIAVAHRGRMIDTRVHRLVMPADNRHDALALTSRIHRTTGVRPQIQSRLLTLPWAEIRVDIDGTQLTVATNYLRLTSNNNQPLKVRGLSFGIGHGTVGRADRSYRGELYVTVNANGQLALVNILGAEALLRGVVPSELFASAPSAALKAQAVAARNQLFAKLGHRHHSDPFHLCSEQHCQVYTGVSREDPRTDAAIESTRGELLFRDERLVDTVYSSTCGGHTEDNDAVWGNVANPALRGRPDFDVDAHPGLAHFANGIDEDKAGEWLRITPQSYCSEALGSMADKLRWTRRFSADDVDTLVARHFPKIGHVDGLRVVERGRGGRVTILDIHGSGGRRRVFHELTIRQLFNHLNSAAFVVEPQPGGGFEFHGGGWGHGVGMCQWGAVGRAKSGQSYRRILRHYYNGAQVEKVYSTPSVHLIAPRIKTHKP